MRPIDADALWIKIYDKYEDKMLGIAGWEESPERKVVQGIVKLIHDMPTVDIERTIVTTEMRPSGNKPKVLANKSKILIPDNRQYVGFDGPVLSEADRESDITQPAYICSFERKGKFNWFLSKKSCCMDSEGTVYSQEYIKKQIQEHDYVSFVRYNPYGLAWIAGLQYQDEPIIRISEHEFFDVTVPYPVWVEKGNGHPFWGLLSNKKIVCFEDDFKGREDDDGSDYPCLSLNAMELDLDYVLNDGYTVFYDKYFTARDKVTTVEVETEQKEDDSVKPSDNLISW